MLPSQSKSAEAEGSRINLTDTPDEIAKKIKRCKVYTTHPLPCCIWAKTYCLQLQTGRQKCYRQIWSRQIRQTQKSAGPLLAGGHQAVRNDC